MLFFLAEKFCAFVLFVFLFVFLNSVAFLILVFVVLLVLLLVSSLFISFVATLTLFPRPGRRSVMVVVVVLIMFRFDLASCYDLPDSLSLPVDFFLYFPNDLLYCFNDLSSFVSLYL